MSGGTDPVAGGSVISLPKGGGAISGLGEKFSPDLFTGTGNFSVPIALPAGRRGLQPELALTYSTGEGNGAFGVGWRLSLPGVARKTSRGIPRYRDAGTEPGDRPDVFVLSGAEDLVAVHSTEAGRVRYRPRTEGLFARIEHVRDATGDYWEVRSKDGLLTRYGTPRPQGANASWRDPAAIYDPAADGQNRIFGWQITETRDPLGNLIRYEYRRDHGQQPGHLWDQPLLSRISYADYGDRADPAFLVGVELDYEARPDPFSNRRAGFEIRTTLRCRTIRIVTHAADGVRRVAREHGLGYERAPFNGASLLTRVDVVGVDDQSDPPQLEHLPPLTFDYSRFEPGGRRFEALTGPGLPSTPFSDRSVALVDLHGNGLPDVVELGTTKRYWTNRGEGRFDLSRTMSEAPSHSLTEPGVQFLDANGDGRADLLVTSGAQAGYFPLAFSGEWNRHSYQPYRQIPSVGLGDPNVKLVDLDGDGLTDILRSGTRLECWFNDPDPRLAWQRNTVGDLPDGAPGPAMDLSDPHVRLADMTGDGLQDIVLLYNANIAYWPNLGHGRWGQRVQMRSAPRLPEDYNPQRVLLGDVDGDGLADFVYVDRGRTLVWGNQTGNAWTAQPVTITGTPDVSDTDALRLADLHGTGMGGVLWSRPANGADRTHLRFLDLTGGRKPYLLTTMDNHMGAQTTVQYLPSTRFYLQDQTSAATRWRTPLPFPVHVVARVEVNDQLSKGRLTTEYRYRHGYWDGVEREFRGFAMVEHQDTETFPATGTGPDATGGVQYSPPTLTKTWFHVGPVAAIEAGDWSELDLSHEYWLEDPQQLTRPAEMTAFLRGLPRGVRRSALRALRGQVLRSELYALDASTRQNRPYTVTESLCGVREETAPAADNADRERVFFTFALGQRTTQWERGTEPMTQFAFTASYDAYGFATKQLAVAVPRGRDPRASHTAAGEPYLATYSVTEYARRDDPQHYLVDRVARTTSYEVLNDGRESVSALCDSVLTAPPSGALSLRVIAHSRTFYDGDAFSGLPLGQLGNHGIALRAESLAFTDSFLDELFDPTDPLAVSPRPVYLKPGGEAMWGPEYPDAFRALTPPLAGYVHYLDADISGSPGGYYVVTGRQRYDIHDPQRAPRGLPVASRDPLGAESQISYDEHDLLPTQAIDPAGLITKATYDLRVLQPHTVTDVNGNSSSAMFSPTGLVTAHYVRGKNGEGDATAPSTRMTYDLLAFAERGQPVSVRSTRRVHHDTDTDAPAAERDDVIVSVQHSDGLGRALQTRSQAEDTLFGDPVFGGGVISPDQSQPITATVGRTRHPGDPDNVIVSGWQTYDNKGRIVEKYEPFIATGYDYAPSSDFQLGQKVSMFYDPRGQAVRTVNPDGSQQLVVLGVPVDLSHPDVYAPTAWETFTYDANDNAGRTHTTDAQLYANHWNTPTSSQLDALGRTIVAVARNGPDPPDWYVTHSAYDIQGNLTAITDALGRDAFEYRFDLAKRRWRVDSIDAGRHDSVPDALGEAVEGRDSKGSLTLDAFDMLRRPTRVWARDDATGPVTPRQVLAYGDGGVPDQPIAERDAARARNLLGRLVAHHDEAGVVTVADADFKGNVVDTARRVIADAPILATYEQAAATGWHVTPFQVDWQPRAGQTPGARADELLEATEYRTTTSFDALNRVIHHVLPQNVEGRSHTLRPQYNRAGVLEQIRLDDEVYIERIAYDTKGQRALIAYGNGVMTRYAYDTRTFRLKRLRSERYTKSDATHYNPTGEALQDLAYDYDVAGNILAIRDRAPGSGIPNNPLAFAASDPIVGALLASGDALNRGFTYDPLYRLRTATGRECDAPPEGLPWLDTPRCTDLTQTRGYTDTYHYDAMGNMLQLGHRDNTNGLSVTRQFTGELVNNAGQAINNRLRHMRIGQHGYDYAFDANGNMRSETTSRHFQWNHSNQMKAFGTQTQGAEPSVHAQYLYDAGGQRVKKLVRKQGNQIEVTHYIGTHFEHHRSGGGSRAAEHNYVHVMDDTQRIAIVRIGAAHPEDRGPATQFQLTDHLRSCNLLVDSAGARIHREEFTSYGETSFGHFAKHRYRFTGRERDEESGLSYHGARYYAPWKARWVTVDPEQSQFPGYSPFCYCVGNPVGYVDLDGKEPESATITVYHRTSARQAHGMVQRGITRFASRWHAHLGDGFYTSSSPNISAAKGDTVIAVKINAANVKDLTGQLGPLYGSGQLRGATSYRGRTADNAYSFKSDGPHKLKMNEVLRQYPDKTIAIRMPDGTTHYVVRNTGSFVGKPSIAGKIDDKGRFVPRTPAAPAGFSSGGGISKPGVRAPMWRDLPAPPGERDYYGQGSLFQALQFAAAVATGNWVGAGIMFLRCMMDNACRKAASGLPTGGMPATGLVFHGGYRGLLRSPGDSARELLRSQK